MTPEIPTSTKRVKHEEKYLFYSPSKRRPVRVIFKPYQATIVVPDRNMTISVIMSKYAGGQHRGLEPQYCPPEMMDYVQGIDARKLSICELHERINENRNRITQLQKTMQSQEQARLQKQAEIAQKKYREDLLKELKETQSTNTP